MCEQHFGFFLSRNESQMPFAYLSFSFLNHWETWHLSPEMLMAHNLENIMATQEK